MMIVTTHPKQQRTRLSTNAGMALAKAPFAIYWRAGETVAFGGICEDMLANIITFATLTVYANPEFTLLQERMPVLLERTDAGCEAWRRRQRSDAFQGTAVESASDVVGELEGEQPSE